MEIDRMQPGQRIVSNSEPELGLGIVMKADAARVEVFFPAAGEQRQYAVRSAPLRRVRFKEGDRLKLHSGEAFVVDRVEERAGLLVYLGQGREVPEAHLSDTISFSSPEERLLAGQTDELYAFDLRAEALRRRAQLLQNPVRGLVGGRVDLLPHQLFIAGEVANRRDPRVLLADEVGLGKTIEAGLILHRLHRTGRAGRILLLLPETLVHQWFVEMWRRFNLLFSLFDADRCTAIECNQPGTNPFLDSQLVICSLAFLAHDPNRGRQAADAGWDLLVVDEAHHLQWSPAAPSPEYTLVENLAARTPALLLLTATPQQLGPEGHFARLRLLDPARYSNLENFLQEGEHYEKVAAAVGRLFEGHPPSKADTALFGAKSKRIRALCKQAQTGDAPERQALITALLDAFGTGRVMFRNTRAALAGFPKREARLVKLAAAGEKTGLTLKVKWLAEFVRRNAELKILVICKSQPLAERIHGELLREINVRCGIFHEGLTLTQRDRNAAFFAEPEGARLLICSEIGSEGRNFQFAHDLVLFDLPSNPELLEQRIGRLDRIGQTSTIAIHVPYLADGEEEVYARWYHEGLNAFEENVHGAMEIARAQEDALLALCNQFSPAKLKALLKRTLTLRNQVGVRLKRGYDRLLEWNSCRMDEAEGVREKIRATDADPAFEKFFLRMIDFFGADADDMGGGHRSYQLQPGPLMKEPLPGLPAEGLSVTFQRERALFREDVTFLNADHPLATGTLDSLLGGDFGNAAFGAWKGADKESLALEVYLVVECVAPPALHTDRFLPSTPVRVLVDHELSDLTEACPPESITLEKGDPTPLLDKAVVRKKLVPAMLEKAKELARIRMQELVDAASKRMHQLLQSEIDRLEELRELNDHVRPEETARLLKEREDLTAVLSAARLRVDSLRLIWRSVQATQRA
jgi:ATP-dependent helicase HepA